MEGEGETGTAPAPSANPSTSPSVAPPLPPKSYALKVLSMRDTLLSRPWKYCMPDRCRLTTMDTSVDYAPLDAPPSNTRLGFDLRDVSELQPLREMDETAPPHALHLTFGDPDESTRLAIDLLYASSLRACLDEWLPLVPADAVESCAEYKAWRTRLVGPEETCPPAALDDRGPPGSKRRLYVSGYPLRAASIAAPATASPGGAFILKQGWLWKEGHRVKSWKRRHFRLLSDGTLLYFVSAAAEVPIDGIPIAGSKIEAPKHKRKEHSHAVRLSLEPKVTHRKHKYILAGETSAETEEWATAISGRASQLAQSSADEVSSAHEMVVGAMPRPKPGGLRRVLVLGSTGTVGRAALYWLPRLHGARCEVLAATRRPESLDAVEGVRAVRVDGGVPSRDVFHCVDTLLLITPGDERRVDSTLTAARLACDAGVSHIVVLSIASVGSTSSTFGHQFQRIEAEVEALALGRAGCRYTLVRLPLFLENYFAFIDSIETVSSFSSPIDRHAKYTPVAVADVGEALANIVADSEGHYLDRSLTLAGEEHTVDDLRGLIESVCGRPIAYRVCDGAEYREILLSFGFKSWQAEGLLELYALVNQSAYVFSDAELKGALGHEPLSVEQWIRQAMPALAQRDASDGGDGRHPRPSIAPPPRVRYSDVGVRPRQPTLAISTAMERLMEDVAALELAGKHEEAAQLQSERLVQMRDLYHELSSRHSTLQVDGDADDGPAPAS